MVKTTRPKHKTLDPKWGVLMHIMGQWDARKRKKGDHTTEKLGPLAHTKEKQRCASEQPKLVMSMGRSKKTD